MPGDRADRATEDLLRELAPQVLGALVRRYGQFDRCEDATQEALLAAAVQWPRDGVPDNPKSWLIAVAARRLTDLLRPDQARRRREDTVARWAMAEIGPPVGERNPAYRDDTLVLFFLCCHPSLSVASQIALTLRAVGGLNAAGAGTWDVTISGTDVQQGVNADCNAITWTCPFNETNTIVAFQGEIGDWQQWSDPAQRNDFNGLDQWTSVELTEIPPQITGNPLTISEELGNSHELNGQVFEGFWYAVLPNAFLVTPGPTSTEIAITGITFSARTVHIKRGSITPTAPTGLSTRRVSATVAYLTFRAARPRGSYVRSYQGRCKAAHHTTRYGKASRSPVKVTSLARGVSYVCRVRAKAAVGYGPWSRGRKLVG